MLGAFGEVGLTGKPVGDDLREGKPTSLMAVAADRAGAAHRKVLTLVGRPDLTEGQVEAIQSVLVETGALGEVELTIDSLASDALRPPSTPSTSPTKPARRWTSWSTTWPGAISDRPTASMKVLVVGAGLGGLSAAAHLLARGHQVQVVEREGMPGGRAGVVAEQGYRLDNGPTVLTMPDLLARAFAAAGAEMSDFVKLRPVDPMYRAVFADGTELRVWHGRERMRAEISELSGPADADGFDRFSDWLAACTRWRCRTS